MVTSWEQTSTEESIDQRNVPTARTASTDQQAMFENGEQPSNGDNDRGKAREPRWRGAIRTFTPQWYSVSMDIGIISILMHQNYYHGSWLNILSTIMFVFNIVVYAFFTGILLLRLIMYPKAAASQSKSSDEQAASWCCPIIAWMTITAQVSLTVSQAYWGGYAWTMVAYVMWWIGQTWMLAIIAASIILFSKSDVVHDRTLSPSVFMLAVGSCTTASIGATIVNYSIDMNARLAVPVIVVSYMHVGLGALLGHMLYTLFLHRLMSSGPPPAQKVPSLVMMAGPFGQGAAALTLLGTACSTYFGEYNRGTFLTSQSGQTMSSASVLIAFLLLGLDTLLIVIAVYFVLEYAFKRQLSFSMTWWTTIFPLGTVNLGLIALATSLNSPAFGVLASALLVLLVVDFLCCSAFTLRGIVRGGLLSSSEHNEEQDKDD